MIPPSVQQATPADEEEKENKENASGRNPHAWRAQVIPGSAEQDIKSCHAVSDDEKLPDLEDDVDDDECDSGSSEKKEKTKEKKKKKHKKKKSREERRERKKKKKKEAEPAEKEDQRKVILTGSCGCPRKTLTEFRAERQKQQDRKLGVTNKTNERRINKKNIQDAVDAADKCARKYKCCAELRFHVVRHIRTLLYGPGMSQAKRRKIVCSWLLEVLNETKKKLAKQNIEWTGSNSITEWFLYDLSYESSSIKRRIFCCRECFVRCTGVSNGSINSWLNELKKGNVSIAMEESKRSRFVDEKTPERMLTTTWMEMYVNEQACKSPDGKKSEVFASSRKEMYEHFIRDWNDQVISGGVYRKFTGRRKKTKKKPEGVPPLNEEEKARGGDDDEEDDEEKHQDVIDLGPPTYQYFCKVWAKDFNEYKIPRHQRRFTQCNWCCEIKGNLKYAKDEDKIYWRQCLFDHYAWVTVQRDKYYKHRYKATKQKSK